MLQASICSLPIIVAKEQAASGFKQVLEARYSERLIFLLFTLKDYTLR